MRALVSTLMGAAVVLGATAAGAQDLNTAQAPASAVTTTGGSITDTSGPRPTTRWSWVTWGSGTSGRPTCRPCPSRAAWPAKAERRRFTPWAAVTGSTTRSVSRPVSASASRCGSNTRTVQSGGNTMQQSSDNPNFFGLGLQVGLPIMVAEGEAPRDPHRPVPVPPLRHERHHHGLGHDDHRQHPQRRCSSASGPTRSRSLQFGFIGLPQLGLQAQFGLGISYSSNSFKSVVISTNDTTTSSSNSFGLGTTVGPNYGLTEIITGSLSAIWYFGAGPGR